MPEDRTAEVHVRVNQDARPQADPQLRIRLTMLHAFTK
jgi:hypothetical protein